MTFHLIYQFPNNMSFISCILNREFIVNFQLTTYYGDIFHLYIDLSNFLETSSFSHCCNLCISQTVLDQVISQVIFTAPDDLSDRGAQDQFYSTLIQVSFLVSRYVSESRSGASVFEKRCRSYKWNLTPQRIVCSDVIDLL